MVTSFQERYWLMDHPWKENLQGTAITVKKREKNNRSREKKLFICLFSVLEEDIYRGMQFVSSERMLYQRTRVEITMFNELECSGSIATEPPHRVIINFVILWFFFFYINLMYILNIKFSFIFQVRKKWNRMKEDCQK